MIAVVIVVIELVVLAICTYKVNSYNSYIDVKNILAYIYDILGTYL